MPDDTAGLSAGPRVDIGSHLDEFFYFVQIVKHGGFSAAASALMVPKSTLSRRLSTLEKRLGAQLVQRSTRQFALTPTGRQLMQHCVAMLQELEAGIGEITGERENPSGRIVIGCTMNAARVFVGSAVTGFLQRYTEVEVEVRLLDRGASLHESGVDVALRVAPALEDGRYVAKRLWQSPQMIVAAPSLLAGFPKVARPRDLAALPALELVHRRGRRVWTLVGSDGTAYEHTPKPRLTSDDIEVVHQAALSGAGIARLPTLVCAADLAAGRLVPVLPGWRIPARQLYAVFLSRHGLTPLARLFIDYLGAWFEAQPDWRA